ncbi:MAG: hypothetical protein IVW57_19080 [Ktedonobacterales bacterium]|nr:hypothetical protein [Ktedonobacterales bacterium]
MTSYECDYCGVSYRGTDDMRVCAVCGQSLASRWFHQRPPEDGEARQPQGDERRHEGPAAARGEAA